MNTENDEIDRNHLEPHAASRCAMIQLVETRADIWSWNGLKLWLIYGENSAEITGFPWPGWTDFMFLSITLAPLKHVELVQILLQPGEEKWSESAYSWPAVWNRTVTNQAFCHNTKSCELLQLAVYQRVWRRWNAVCLLFLQWSLSAPTPD